MNGHRVQVDSLRSNNFDLIRLLAALQVVIGHGRGHLHADSAWLTNVWHVLGRLPGVPVFFVISGFLISTSWERSPQVGDYFRNRLLRIYPALWACLFVSIISALVVGYRPEIPSIADGLVWLAAQLSIVQFYNPAFLQDYGLGTLNGSLWTIPVELQFYLLVPPLYLGIRRFESHSTAFLLVLIAVFLVPNVMLQHFGYLRGTTVGKLLTCTFVPWFYLFLIGVVCQRNWDRIDHRFRGRFWWWFGVYVVISLLSDLFGLASGGNQINPIACLGITALVLSAAYSWQGAGDRILARNDVSYGVYIYHMPVINALVFVGITGWRGLLLMLPITVLLAIMSWLFVERPALALKHRSWRGTISGP